MGTIFYYQGAETTVPAAGYTFINIPFGEASGLSMLSLGWQNLGFATGLYASQMFISTGGTTGNLQLVNTSLNPIQAIPYVVYTGNAALSTRPSATNKKGKIEKK